jgi:pimeloyl-ACP methyl ester carboxylesterase
MDGRSRLILLPGLDGTGELFAPLLHYVPRQIEPMQVRYPVTGDQRYDALLSSLEAMLPDGDPAIVMAESFSSPLAVRYAARHVDSVRALVLCAGFVRAPVSSLTLQLAMFLVGLRPPRWAVRKYLVGAGATAELTDAVRSAIAQTPVGVLRARLRAIGTVDCRADLAACRLPLMLLLPSEDRLLNARSAREILRVGSRARVEVIDGPHLLAQRCPREVWSSIARFLNELDLHGELDEHEQR